jgi:hypothetical protein
LCVQQEASSANPNLKGLPIMKLAIRIFALSVVFAGTAASTVPSSTTNLMASRQSATASFPVPACGPGVPMCGNK